jgi:hypothetical protein
MHSRAGDSRIDYGLVLKVYHRPPARVYTNIISLASVLVEYSCNDDCEDAAGICGPIIRDPRTWVRFYASHVRI